jgi:hypothetical protein
LKNPGEKKNKERIDGRDLMVVFEDWMGMEGS